jgi:hypothetical protein
MIGVSKRSGICGVLVFVLYVIFKGLRVLFPFFPLCVGRRVLLAWEGRWRGWRVGLGSRFFIGRTIL